MSRARFRRVALPVATTAEPGEKGDKLAATEARWLELEAIREALEATRSTGRHAPQSESDGGHSGTNGCFMTNATPPFGMTVCGTDELAGHRDIGANHVLSILDPNFPVPEAFGTFGEHKTLELRFDDIIEETLGRSAPQPEHVEHILAFGRDLMAEPRSDAHLLVRCHADISRSTASMALLLAQALPEQPADMSLTSVSRHPREGLAESAVGRDR